MQQDVAPAGPPLRVADDVAVAGRIGQVVPRARLAPRGAAVGRNGVAADEPPPVGELHELRLVAHGGHGRGRGEQAPGAAPVVGAADVVVEGRPPLARVGCGHGEEQRAVLEGQGATRGGEHRRDGRRGGVAAPGAVELGRDVLGGAPRQAVVGAARDANARGRLGRRGPEAAAGGEDAHHVARAGVDHEGRIAVAARLGVLRDGDRLAPRRAAVGASAQHHVDQVGQVALRVAAAVGHGQQRAVGGRHDGRNAVVLRAVVARGEEPHVDRLGGRADGAGRQEDAAEQQRRKEEGSFHLFFMG